MKRRLMNAYDAMTMPEGCRDRIEQRLQQEQKARESGENVKLIAPISRRKPWAAIGAVCVVLMLGLGGMGLFLYGSQRILTAPAETAVTETAKTPEDHYAPATQLTVEEVENFAKVVRSNILTKNWAALGDKIQYPITIDGHWIPDKAAFEALMAETELGSHFLLAMKYESCSRMCCDEGGIFLGDGQIGINETWQRLLKITQMDRLMETSEDMQHFTIMTEPDGTRFFHWYSGYAESVVFPPAIGNSVLITGFGTGGPVIENGTVVKYVTLPETVTTVGDYAFSNCPGLEAVFFRGDAPPEAEGVFEGSENVTVYYEEGTSGWGKIWCGRETKPTTRLGITIEAADALEQQKKANEAFREVLEGGRFLDLMDLQEVTLAEYCEKKAVSMPAFTMVDMDRDGVKELVLKVSVEGNGHENFLILRQESGKVRGYSCDGQMSDLKKDGSFYWIHDAKRQGESVLEFRDDCLYMSWAPQTDRDRIPVLWHIYPCQRPEFVLGSYAYVSGTGQSLFPGNSYFVLEMQAAGAMANDWEMVKSMLLQWGMVCEETEGTVTVYDPDAPGTALYGVLTEDGTQFTSLGCCLCMEDREYQAEMREMTSGTPQYWVDGTQQVAGGGELIAYFAPVKEW